MPIVTDIIEFLNLNRSAIESLMRAGDVDRGGWVEDEKDTFFKEFPYFFQRVYPERDFVLEGWRPDFLLGIAVGAVKVINKIKTTYTQEFKGFKAGKGDIGWRPMLSNGADIKVSSIDTSAAASVPTWDDWIGTYSSSTVVRLSDYHGIVLYGINLGPAKAKKVDGYRVWDVDWKEFPKYFPDNIMLFPSPIIRHIKEGIGIRLRITVKENLGYLSPHGIVIGLVDQYLNSESPSW